MKDERRAARRGELVSTIARDKRSTNPSYRGAGLAGLLYADVRHLGLEARMPKRLGPRYAGEAECLDRAELEYQIARVIPRLAREDDDVDIVEPIKRNGSLFSAAHGVFDDHTSVGKPIASTGRIDCSEKDKRQSRNEHVKVDRQNERNRKQRDEAAKSHRDAKNASARPDHTEPSPEASPTGRGHRRPDGHHRDFFECGGRNACNGLFHGDRLAEEQSSRKGWNVDVMDFYNVA